MLGKQMGKLFRSLETFSEKLHLADGPLIRLPQWLRFPNLHSFNFILLHYIYLIFMTLLGSAILAGSGNLRYIDCVFFAAGSSTQSGLNTVDINLLKTYQQVTLLTIACLCNPIVINTFVVFVRLYWFEKRFQRVVSQADALRRHRTKSRTKSEERRDVEWLGADADQAVRTKDIHVLHGETGQHFKGFEKDAIAASSGESGGSVGSGPLAQPQGPDAAAQGDGGSRGLQSPTSPTIGANPTLQRDIKFADELARQPMELPNEERLPEQLSPEQHIMIVENQRHPKETGALRIPDPRDWDRGDLPQRIDDGDRELERGRQAPKSADGHSLVDATNPNEINEDGHPLGSEVEAAHPKKPKLKNFVKHLSFTQKSTDGDRGSEIVSLRRRASSRTRTLRSFLSQEREDIGPSPYLSYAPTVGRNSAFVDLTEEQREELGGIEYRALKTLARILLVYFFGFSVIGIVIFVPWIILLPEYKAIVQGDGQAAPWWGVFTPLSMFTDLGFTLTPDSMISFGAAVMPMLLGSFLIIIGNTGFPCMLRFVIWLFSHFVPYGGGLWEELHFLLDHPRRCFTLLFPRKATWWLFFVLVVLNGIDLIFFIILDLHDPTVTTLRGGVQFLDGLFQAASTRTAGFSCVNLANLHPAIQVSYLIMMYISVFPIAISVRQTNVYEEKSLGVYSNRNADLGDPDDPNAGDEAPSYLGSHLRRQLSFDLWYVFLGLFFICIIEGDRLANTNEFAFTIFSVLFEIVSAYGTVGLSLGYPGINASFSTEFRNLSKLIIVAMMLRGRHRGLPYALDRAILLPSDSLERKEAEEAERRRERRASLLAQLNSPLAVDSPPDLGGVGNLPLSSTQARRRASVTTAGDDDTQSKRPRSRAGLTAIISGALSAGPSGKGKMA